MSQQPLTNTGSGAITAAGSVAAGAGGAAAGAGGIAIVGNLSGTANIINIHTADGGNAIADITQALKSIQRRGLSRPPRKPVIFVDRETELNRLDQLIAAHQAVGVLGLDGAGKTALLREAANRPSALALPDGVIYLEGIDEHGAALGPDDLIQRLYDKMFVSNPPLKVNFDSAQSDLGNTQPLVILDSFDLPVSLLNRLPDLFPNGAMLIGATHAPPVDTLAPMKVTALPRDESISLFATVAGMSAVDKDAQDSILAAICELLADVPLAIVTAARVASTNKLSPEQARATLESVKPPSSDPEQAGIERAYGLAYSTLSENERRLLQTIAVLPGVSVDPDLLARLISGKVSAQSLTPGIVVKDGYVIVGGARLRVRDYAQPPAGETGTTRPPVDAEWVAAAIERLKSIGLLHENSPRLRIDPGLRGLARLGVDEAAIQDQLLTQMLYDVMRNKTRDPEYCDDELGSILGAIDWAATQHRQADVIALCRSIDSHLMQNGLWDAWGKVADRGLQAARANGDRFNEAWALHQLGTRSLGLSRIDEATRLLQQALSIRQAIGDKVGLAASQHNLDVLSPPPPPPDERPKPPEPGPETIAKPAGLGLLKPLLAIAVIATLVFFSGSLIVGARALGACDRQVRTTEDAFGRMEAKINAAKQKRAGESFMLVFTEEELSSYMHTISEREGLLTDARARLVEPGVVVICGQYAPAGDRSVAARFDVIVNADRPFQLESLALEVIPTPNSPFGWVALPNSLADSLGGSVQNLMGDTYVVTSLTALDDFTWQLAIRGK